MWSRRTEMTRALCLAVLLAMVVGRPAVYALQKAGGGSLAAVVDSARGAEREVLQAMVALEDASTAKDRAALTRLLADEYLYHASNGAIFDKATDIESTVSDNTTWTEERFDRVKVRVYGDFAVVTGIITLSGASKSFSAGARNFTRLWVRRGGQWQCVGGQATLVVTK